MQLQQMVASKQDNLLPKKKFAFKARKKLVSTATSNAVSEPDNVANDSSGNLAVLRDQTESVGSAGKSNPLPTNSVVAKDRSQEHLVLEVWYMYLVISLMRTSSLNGCAE